MTPSAKELQPSDSKITFFGWDTGPTRHEYSAAPISILTPSAKNEAMSFAILEAMNAGLPCVVTDVGGNRDLAETGIRCGTVVNYGDTESFARAILELMENDKLRETFSENAVTKVSEDFDLTKLAWDVFRAYQ